MANDRDRQNQNRDVETDDMNRPKRNPEDISGRADEDDDAEAFDEIDEAGDEEDLDA